MKRIAYETMRTVMGALCMVAGGISEGTNAATIKIAVAIDYAIDSILYEKAITDNIAMNALAEQAVSTKCMYLVSIDSSGAVALVKGDEVGLTADAFLPDVPSGSCPIAAIKVETDGVTTFTSGTTDLSAAGITDTYYDLMRATASAF